MMISVRIGGVSGRPAKALPCLSDSSPANVVFPRQTTFSRGEPRFPPAAGVFLPQSARSSRSRRFPPAIAGILPQSAFSGGSRHFPEARGVFLPRPAISGDFRRILPAPGALGTLRHEPAHVARQTVLAEQHVFA
jgi:hypothetical protein